MFHDKSLSIVFKQKVNYNSTDQSSGRSHDVHLTNPASQVDNNNNNDICKGNANATCDMVVNDNDNGLQCDSCKSWYHAKCQNVSDNDYEIMDSLPADLLNWFCHNCKPSVSKLLKVVTDISDRCDTIESNVAALDTRVTELETKDNESSDTMRDLVQGECKKLLFEERDKTRRKSNIIIRGLSEPTNDNDQGKIDEDKAKVLNICINELGLEENKINIKRYLG